jgi:hypothetical protein
MAHAFRREGVRGAGVPPAVLCSVEDNQPAGETPAPQGLFSLTYVQTSDTFIRMLEFFRAQTNHPPGPRDQRLA